MKKTFKDYVSLLTLLFVLSFALILTVPAIAANVLSPVNSDSAVQLEASDAQSNTELLIYDENRAVTIADRGFPRDDPPRSSANGNWKTPINYAEGTLYFRVQIRSQPVPQNMRIQFCMWQYQFTLENCGSQKNVSGESGTVVTWDQPVGDMWKLNGNPMDWVNPRQRYGSAIKNSAGDPVSNYNGWNWNGENPNHWYPLNMRHTVVVVAKGATFSGWSNYVGGGGGQPNPTPTNTPVPPSQPTATPPPAATPTPTNPSDPGGSGSGDIITNGGFENGASGWSYYSAQGGGFSTGNPAYSGSKGAKVTIAQANNNVQLYQQGLQLKANTSYKLSFWGYSNSGRDLNVYLHKHSNPYTYYGLSSKINMGTSWNKHEVVFTTTGFSGTTSNARLRFWLSSYGTAGDIYYFDDVSLEETGSSAPPAPTATPTPDPSEPPPSQPGGGMSGSNQIANGSFENGQSFWSFHTGGQGSFNIVNSSIEGNKGARVSVTTADDNIQLYQRGITLKEDTSYRLSFYAYSNSGNDLNVYLHKHTAPYTYYGLSKKVQLGQEWKQYVVEFSTSGISGETSNARLRFWLSNSAEAGDRYFFDDLVLTELSETSGQVTGLSYSIPLLESSLPDVTMELQTSTDDDAEADNQDITDIADGADETEDIQVSDEDGATNRLQDSVFLPFTVN